MNYYDTLIEVADDCPAKEAQVPQARGAKKTKAVVEYELLAKHPYKYTEEDIAFEMYAVVQDIPKAIWPTERKKFLSKGHPHLRVSALAKRYGWGIHNNAEGKIALDAVESPEYKQLLNDPRPPRSGRFARSARNGYDDRWDGHDTRRGRPDDEAAAVELVRRPYPPSATSRQSTEAAAPGSRDGESTGRNRTCS
jgi:hypothetical protein